MQRDAMQSHALRLYSPREAPAKNATPPLAPLRRRPLPQRTSGNPFHRAHPPHAFRNIRRQGHDAQGFDGVVQRRAGEIEGENNLAVFTLLFDARVERREKTCALRRRAEHAHTRQWLASWPAAQARAIRSATSARSTSHQSALASPAARAIAGKTRVNDARVVDDERVAFAQIGGKIAYAASSKGASPAGTTNMRALSRGLAGRNAILSCGRSKSKRSTRIY